MPCTRIRTRLAAAAGAIALASIGGLPAFSSPAAPEPHRAPALDFIVGTWTGTSTCVGDRPACKDETVVYRFVALEGKPGQVRLLGDKIVQGKRLPMGALIFDVAHESKTVRCEFQRVKTHGVWSFTVADTVMTGSLLILPDRSIAREVTVRRVDDRDVPEAPPLSDYEE